MRIYPAVLLSLLWPAVSLQAADHAAILLYHHVSGDTPSSTSVSPAVFRRHLEYLDSEGFTVLPLGRVLNLLAEKNAVPEKTVCITFDDAYRSVHEQAFPLLQEKNWPFTVFVATEAIDRGYGNYLAWEELRQLVAGGAEIGNHSHSHSHLVRQLAGETDQQWRDRVAADINLAGRRLQDELGVVTALFAYPYGEHTPELQEVVGALGYTGIAQQSGAVGYGSDKQAVPRFPMATGYADMSRFAVSVRSRPLPVTDVSAGPVVLIAGEKKREAFSFSLGPGAYRIGELACYSSSGEKLSLQRTEEKEGSRFVVELPAWGAGRRKINCTAPSTQENGVYYWYSRLWLVREPGGGWYSE